MASNDLLMWETQLRKGSLVLAILAVLSSERRYGLEILKELEKVGGLSVPEGTIYPLLNRLSSEGLVDSEWVASPAGHPRKYYKLTHSGRAQLRRMAASWTAFTASVDMLLESIEGRK